MVESNIVHVLAGFLRAGYERVFLIWVLHHRDLIERLLAQLEPHAEPPQVVHLVAEPDCLRGRLQRREPARDPSLALDRLEQIRALQYAKVDATQLSAEQVADELRRFWQVSDKTVSRRDLSGDSVLYLVAGAPDAGKTRVCGALVELHTAYVALDMDVLIDSASRLAQGDIHFDAATWPAYRALWFDVLEALRRNHQIPVLFAAFAPDDLEAAGLPDGWSGAEWLLLDCSEATRRKRLAERGWPEERVNSALSDATALRRGVAVRLETDSRDASAVAVEVREWLDASSSRG
jgi:hypothetical protein